MDRYRHPGRHRAPVDPLAPLRPRAYAVVAGMFLAGLLLSGSLAVVSTAPGTATFNPAANGPADLPAPDPGARPVVLIPSPIANPEPAPAAASTQATWTVIPLTNEGMIALVTRICGPDRVRTWRANALANGITPPLYRVRADATLTIDCYAEVLPPDPSESQPKPTATPAEPVSAPAPEPQPEPVPVPLPAWVNPLPGTCIGSGFRSAERPGHNGIDLGAGLGTPIYAAAAGTVSVGWEEGGAGNYTVIDHGGVWTVYMHQSSYQVTSGWVNAGDVIGYVGSTGDSSGPHLHFEVQTLLWSDYVDPAAWMADRGVGWAWC